MTVGVGHGVLREVALATPGSSAYAFLTRDDAGSRSSAVAGRQLRFGQAVDTSPYSTWKQTVWTGGAEQKFWKDEGMFDEGFVDGTDRRGRVKPWPGWYQYNAQPDNTAQAYVTCMIQGATGIYGGADSPLLYGFSDGNLIKADVNGTLTAVGAFGSKINCMARYEDHSSPSATTSTIVIGLENGTIKDYNVTTNSYGPDITNTLTTDPSYQAPVMAMVSYNGSQYIAQGPTLYKRAPSNTWSGIKHFADASRIFAMVLYQGKIWIGVRTFGNLSRFYICDGTAVTWAFDIPDFGVESMVEHYGSLFISGASVAFTSDLGSAIVRGRIYKYNGSSLTMLTDFRDKEVWSGSTSVYLSNLVSWDRFLVCGVQGTGGTPGNDGERPSFLLMYDAEEDALHRGPFVWAKEGTGKGAKVTAICLWSQTIAAAFYHDYDFGVGSSRYPWMVAAVRRAGSITNENFDTTTNFYRATINSSKVVLKSSWFDADLPQERKTWLAITVRFKLGDNSSLRVLWENEDGSEDDVAFWSATDAFPDPNPHSALATRTVHLRPNSSSPFWTSVRGRFKLEFNILDAAYDVAAENTAVEDVIVHYLVTPTRRRVWRMRMVCDDAQARLDGSANSLTTKDALVAKLQEFWENGTPILMWGPFSSPPNLGTLDPVNAVLVQVTEYSDNTYRVSSDSTVEYAEVAVSLLEVPPSGEYANGGWLEIL